MFDSFAHVREGSGRVLAHEHVSADIRRSILHDRDGHVRTFRARPEPPLEPSMTRRLSLLLLGLGVVVCWVALAVNNERHHHRYYRGRVDSPSGRFAAVFAEDEWRNSRDHSVAVALVQNVHDPEWIQLFEWNAFFPAELVWENDNVLLLRGRIQEPERVPLQQRIEPLGITIRVEPSQP